MRYGWIILAGVMACTSTPRPPDPEPAPTPMTEAAAPEAPPFACPEERGLCFRVEPASAELIVNGENRGRLDEIGVDGQLFLPLEAGIYRVTLSAEGRVTWRTEVSVQDGAESIEVTLALPE